MMPYFHVFHIILFITFSFSVFVSPTKKSLSADHNEFITIRGIIEYTTIGEIIQGWILFRKVWRVDSWVVNKVWKQRLLSFHHNNLVCLIKTDWSWLGCSKFHPSKMFVERITNLVSIFDYIAQRKEKPNMNSRKDCRAFSFFHTVFGKIQCLCINSVVFC